MLLTTACRGIARVISVGEIHWRSHGCTQLRDVEVPIALRAGISGCAREREINRRCERSTGETTAEGIREGATAGCRNSVRLRWEGSVLIPEI